MINPDEVKDQLYAQLDTFIAAVPKSDKLFILGDFNAHVGTDHQTYAGVIGKHGTGDCNNNCLLLLQTCTTHGPVITNRMFHLPKCNETSWMHSRSKQWHLIDYVIRTKVTKSMCGAECWTDHKLMVSRLTLRIQAQCEQAKGQVSQ